MTGFDIFMICFIGGAFASVYATVCYNIILLVLNTLDFYYCT